jgi:protein-S-isoprenylcysteine O-methyltransferase Ste14
MSAADDRQPWWRGARGEWYVVAQVALIALVFLGPRTAAGLPDWPAPVARIATGAGAILMLAGGALFVGGMVRLGANLTPLPHPRADATLVTTGAYAVVRHPLYAGGLGFAFGWALAVAGWLTLVWAMALLVLLDRKSAREERWLVRTFPGYPDYQRRVRKLIPFLY